MPIPSWTPFCPQKPNYEHNSQCEDQQACPYCGQANPFFRPGSPDSIVFIDSPPAMQLPLPRGPAQTARKAAIEKHRPAGAGDQPVLNAGSDVLSSRQQPATRSIFIQTVLYYAEVKDLAVKTYHKWEVICTTRMHLPINLPFNSMEEFISEVGKSVHNWETIIQNLKIFEMFVASDFSPQYGPVHIPDSAWELGLTELLARYFNPASVKEKNMYKVFIFIGRYGDEVDCDTPTKQDAVEKSKEPVAAKRKAKVVKRDPEAKKEPELKDHKIKKEKCQGSQAIKREPLTAPTRPTRKRSFFDVETEMTEGNLTDQVEVDVVPDMPSLDDLISTVLDAPAGRTRRKLN